MNVPPDTGTHFPGGTSVSRLSVYPWTAPDGLAGGTPHFHTTCTEAYVVLGGEGRVQTLSADGFTETALREGVVVCSGPASSTASSTTTTCGCSSSCRTADSRRRGMRS